MLGGKNAGRQRHRACALAALPGPPTTTTAILTQPNPTPLQVLKLPRSGGVVVRSRELRQQARKVRVEEYFYGNRKVKRGAKRRGGRRGARGMVEGSFLWQQNGGGGGTKGQKSTFAAKQRLARVRGPIQGGAVSPR